MRWPLEHSKQRETAAVVRVEPQLAVPDSDTADVFGKRERLRAGS